MAIFEQGDVVRVPFPYTDRGTRQWRPALVVSATSLGDKTLAWVVMITSAEHPAWPGDILLDTMRPETGLRIASRIRMAKIATIEMRHAEALGKVADAVLSQVRMQLCLILGLRVDRG